MSPIRTIRRVLGGVLLAAACAAPTGWAEQGSGIDRQQEQVQARMEDMRSRMAEIRAASDPAERRRLMEAHMRAMHETMRMLGNDMMPAMKRRMHTHTHAPGTGRQSGSVELSQEHMQNMERMMGNMEALMEQMSEHLAMWEADRAP